MFNLLRIRTSDNVPNTAYRGFEFINSTVEYNLDKAIDYYVNNPLFLSSNHILGQYLETLEININLSDHEYYNYLLEEGLYQASLFGMTTSVSRGSVHRGSFYGNDLELLIAYQTNQNPVLATEYWRDLRPVNILRHNYTDLSYTPIDRNIKVKSNINVIGIDVISLALQYRGFRREEYFSKNDDFEKISTFLFKYPLANALYSHVDHVGLNMCIENLLGDRGYVSSDRRARFSTMDISKRYMDGLTSYHERIEKRRRSIGFNLPTIRTLTGSDLRILSNLPSSVNTRQNTWALFYSRMELIKYGLLLSGKDYKSLNSREITYLKTLIRMFKSDRIFEQLSLIRDIVRDELEELEYLLD